MWLLLEKFVSILPNPFPGFYQTQLDQELEPSHLPLANKSAIIFCEGKQLDWLLKVPCTLLSISAALVSKYTLTQPQSAAGLVFTASPDSLGSWLSFGSSWPYHGSFLELSTVSLTPGFWSQFTPGLPVLDFAPRSSWNLVLLPQATDPDPNSMLW